MAGMQVEVLDMSGEHLFRLPKAFNVIPQEDYNSPGEITFSMRPRDLQTSGLMDLREALIRVHVGGRPFPVIGVWDQDEHDLAEGPDRVITCTCPGTLALLDEAILYPEAAAVGEKAEERQFVDSSPGAVVATMVVEAQKRGALAGVQMGFSAVMDSTGQRWEHTISRKWTAGATILSILAELCDQGVLIVRMDGHRLEVAQYGRSFLDTPEVVFQPMLLSSAPRKRVRLGTYNSLLAKGEGGIRTEVVNSDGGRRREVYSGLGSVHEQAELDFLARDALNRMGWAKETYSIAYRESAATPTAWEDFRAGSVVHRLPPFAAEGATPLVVRSVAVRPAQGGGSMETVLEVGDRSVTPYRPTEDEFRDSFLPDFAFPGTLEPMPFADWTGLDYGAGPLMPSGLAPIVTGTDGALDFAVPPSIWDAVPPGGSVEIWAGASPDWGSMKQIGVADGPGRPTEFFPEGWPGFGTPLAGSAGPTGPESLAPVLSADGGLEGFETAGLAGAGLTGPTPVWDPGSEAWLDPTTGLETDPPAGSGAGQAVYNLAFDPELRRMAWSEPTARSLEGVIIGDAADLGLEKRTGLQTVDWTSGKDWVAEHPRRLFTEGGAPRFGIGGRRSGGFLAASEYETQTLDTSTLWVDLAIEPYRVGGWDGALPTRVKATVVDSGGQRATVTVGLTGRAQVTFPAPVTLPVSLDAQVEMPTLPAGKAVGFIVRRIGLFTGPGGPFSGDTPSTAAVNYSWLGTPLESASKKEAR